VVSCAEWQTMSHPSSYHLTFEKNDCTPLLHLVYQCAHCSFPFRQILILPAAVCCQLSFWSTTCTGANPIHDPTLTSFKFERTRTSTT
jgi:hypothetical protein